MGGRSGKAVAAHTLLIHCGGYSFALSKAQMRLAKRALASPTGITLEGREFQSVRTLVAVGAGTLSADGLVFTANPGVKA